MSLGEGSQILAVNGSSVLAFILRKFFFYSSLSPSFYGRTGSVSSYYHPVSRYA